MSDELRDQITDVFRKADFRTTDAQLTDRVLAIVQPKLSEAMAEAEQLRGAFEVAARALRSDVETKAERARCAEAAIERVQEALTNALLVWQPEHEYRLERARRKGYSHDEVAVGVLGEAIKVASGVLAALNPAGGSEKREDPKLGRDCFEIGNYGTETNGTWQQANCFRCTNCGAIGAQAGVTHPDLAQLVAMTERHECLPRVDGTEEKEDPNAL